MERAASRRPASAPEPEGRSPASDLPKDHEAGEVAAAGTVGLGWRLGSEPAAAEREAERVAEAVVSAPASRVEASLRAGRPGTSPRPLSPAERAYFEPHFGDLSAVRLHTGPEAQQATRLLSARAFTFGGNIALGRGEYQPDSREGRRLLAHELTHTVQQWAMGRPVVQRSPLSDSVNAAWTADPTLEALLTRLGRADVQGAQGDTDVDSVIARLLTGRADDLWVAQRIRRGELGRTSGALGPKDRRGRPVPRPVQAFFFRGLSTRRALVIAGVHGTERQGIEVAQRLIRDLATRPPHFTVIVVPSLFPDNAAAGSFGERESGRTPTNRNFPRPDQDLAAATGRRGPVDARGRRILAENVMLLELLERFRPERIITIHGTRRPGAAGVFYDPRQLTAAERQAAWSSAAERASRQGPARTDLYSEGGAEAVMSERRQIYYQENLRQLTTQASDTDRDLSLRAARQIDTATTAITGRDRRTWEREREAASVTRREATGRAAHPSIAGNVGPTGAIDHASWSGSGTGGVSLGEYAPARGMSVFTVEPPINRNTGDYPTSLDPGVDAAERQIELQSYTDALRTVLLGAP